jgi:hypothetical protein
LCLSLKRQRFDDLSDQAGEIVLCIGRVFTFDDMLANEGKVVANENARAECDADRQSDYPAGLKNLFLSARLRTFNCR